MIGIGKSTPKKKSASAEAGRVLEETSDTKTAVPPLSLPDVSSNQGGGIDTTTRENVQEELWEKAMTLEADAERLAAGGHTVIVDYIECFYNRRRLRSVLVDKRGELHYIDVDVIAKKPVAEIEAAFSAAVEKVRVRESASTMNNLARDLSNSPYERERRPYEIDTLPRGAEQTRDQSGAGYAEAREITRGVHRAVQEAGRTEPITGKERAELGREVRTKEEAALRKWAGESGYWIDPGSFPAEPDAEGAEALVYLDKKNEKVTKVNDGLLHQTWLSFLDRIAYHNWLTPEASYTFKGFTEREGKLAAVVEQPFVDAERGATRAEIEEYVGKMGFQRFRNDDYYSPSLGLLMEDLHDENVVVAADGTLIFIDPIFYKAKPEQVPAKFQVRESASVSFDKAKGQSVGHIAKDFDAEVPSGKLLEGSDYAGAQESLIPWVNNSGANPLKALGGRAVYLNAPDEATARKLSRIDGRIRDNDRARLEARVTHALTKEDRVTPDEEKIRTAALIPETVRSADIVSEHDLVTGTASDAQGRIPFVSFSKLYVDESSPTGERWHTVEFRKKGMLFETQYSSPSIEGGRIFDSKVVGIGKSTPKKKGALAEAGRAPAFPAEQVSEQPQGSLPDVSSNQGKGIDTTTRENVQEELWEKAMTLEADAERLAAGGHTVIVDYIECFYNRRRLRSVLDYQSPQNFLTRYFQNQQPQLN